MSLAQWNLVDYWRQCRCGSAMTEGMICAFCAREVCWQCKNKAGNHTLCQREDEERNKYQLEQRKKQAFLGAKGLYHDQSI